MDQYIRKKITDYIAKETIDADGNIILEEGIDPYITNALPLVSSVMKTFPEFDGRTKLYLDKNTRALTGIDSGCGKFIDNKIGFEKGKRTILALSNTYIKILDMHEIYNKVRVWQCLFEITFYNRITRVIDRAKLYTFERQGFDVWRDALEQLHVNFLTQHDISSFEGTNEILDYSPTKNTIYTNPKIHEIILDRTCSYHAKTQFINDYDDTMRLFQLVTHAEIYIEYFENIVAGYKYVNGY